MHGAHHDDDSNSLALPGAPPQAETWRSVPKVVRNGMKTLFEQVEAQRIALDEMGREMKIFRNEVATSNSALETKLKDLVVEQASVVAKGVWTRVDKALRDHAEGVNRTTSEALRGKEKALLASEEDGRMRSLRIERELTSVRERLRSLESGLDDAKGATEEVDAKCLDAHSRLDSAATSIELLEDDLAARATGLEQQQRELKRAQEDFVRVESLQTIVEELTKKSCVEPLQRQIDRSRQSVFEEMAAFTARGETMIEAARKSSEALVEAAEEARRISASKMADLIEERRREVGERLDNLAASILAERESTVQVCRDALDAYDSEHREVVLKILDEREASRTTTSKRKKESLLRDLMLSDENVEDEWSGGGESLMRALVSTCRRAKRACDTEIPMLRTELARVDEAAKRRVGELSSASTAAIAALVEDTKKYRTEVRSACDEAVQAADDVARAGRDDALRLAEKMCEESTHRADKALVAACDRHRKNIDESVRATCKDAIARVDESMRSKCDETRRLVEESVRRTCKETMSHVDDNVRVACDDATRRAGEIARIACEDALQGAERAARVACEDAAKRADEVARTVCELRADSWEATDDSRQQATLAIARDEVDANAQRLTDDFDARLVSAIEAVRSDVEARREEKYTELAADLTRFVETALEESSEGRLADREELVARISGQFDSLKSELQVEIERGRDDDRTTFVRHSDLPSFRQKVLEKADAECAKRIERSLADVVRAHEFHSEHSKFSAALADVVRKPELEAERARDQAELARLLAETSQAAVSRVAEKADSSDDSRVISLMITRLRHDVENEFEQSRQSFRRHVEARIRPLNERFDALVESNRSEHSDMIRHTQKVDRDLATFIKEMTLKEESRRRGCEMCFETREKALQAREKDVERLLVYYDAVRRSQPSQQQQAHNIPIPTSAQTSLVEEASGEGEAHERDEEEKEELAREYEVTKALEERIRSGHLLSHVTSTLQSIAAS